MPRQIYHLLPKNACPICGKASKFIIRDLQSNIYLTNKDGDIIDSKEDFNIAVGMCLNCNTKFDMFPTNNSFIPLTPLRKLLPEYSKASRNYCRNPEEFTSQYIENPISK